MTRELGKAEGAREGGSQEAGIRVTFGGDVEMCVWGKFPAFIATGHCGCHSNVMDTGVCSWGCAPLHF